MEPASEAPEDPGSGRALRRYGPLVAIVVVVAVVGAAIAFTSGDDDGGDDPGEVAGGGLTYETSWGETVTLPESVVSFEVAADQGIEVDWPETCDTDRGTAAVPTFFAPDCFAPFDGDNGGETAEGVTADSIKVVLYQGPDDDPIIDAIASAVSSDTNADSLATYEGYLPYFEAYYETYGREIELIPYTGSGNALDEVAARADAVDIAEEIQPFAVWGGPFLTNAFADELSKQGILNISLLGGGEQPEYYANADPYLFQLGNSPSQGREHVAEYLCNQVAGRPAAHAGDEALQGEERRFGLIYLETGPESAETLTDFEEGLAACGEELVVVESYTNPLDVSAVAPATIAKMKDEGVTSVMLAGDPLTPATYTRTATDQEYFPEWIVTGGALVDTATYARTYDQEQWANAFGVSFNAAREDPEVASSRALYSWFNCEEPPAVDTVELIFGIPALFYSVLQGVGPNLTHQAFRDALFSAEPTPSAITNPSLSWGEPEKGRWDDVDYQGIDDATAIWWDPEATGPDETGTEGTGLYRFVDGGERYLVGEWPEEDDRAFVEEGSITIYDEVPPAETFPDYPRPCDGSATDPTGG